MAGTGSNTGYGTGTGGAKTAPKKVPTKKTKISNGEKGTADLTGIGEG